MGEPKSNLHALRSLTEDLCAVTPDSQCGTCHMLFHADGNLREELVELRKELKEVISSLKYAREECVSLRAEVSTLKRQLKNIKDGDK